MLALSAVALCRSQELTEKYKAIADKLIDAALADEEGYKRTVLVGGDAQYVVMIWVYVQGEFDRNAETAIAQHQMLALAGKS